MSEIDMLNEEQLTEVAGGKAIASNKLKLRRKHMKISCPHCNATLYVDVNNSTEAVCPKCGHTTTFAG